MQIYGDEFSEETEDSPNDIILPESETPLQPKLTLIFKKCKELTPEILKEICEVKCLSENMLEFYADLPMDTFRMVSPTRNAKRKTRHATFYHL